MAKELIPYLEMCRRERAGLRRGMHFGLGGYFSVVLMSAQPQAPYRDRFTEDGTTLIYEGHDAPQSAVLPQPKTVDQPLFTPSGTLTQNGKFHQAAQAYCLCQQPAEWVRVYEKRRQGLWLAHGMFRLVDSWQENDGQRQVCKFTLVAASMEMDNCLLSVLPPMPRRNIPRAVKLTVWQRDGGRCVVCGARERLHYDHIVPYAKGGASTVAENIQLLCARHNLAKGARLL